MPTIYLFFFSVYLKKGDLLNCICFLNFASLRVWRLLKLNANVVKELQEGRGGPRTSATRPTRVPTICGTHRPGACSMQWVCSWNSSTLVRWRTSAGSSVNFSCSDRAWRCWNSACLGTHRGPFEDPRSAHALRSIHSETRLQTCPPAVEFYPVPPTAGRQLAFYLSLFLSPLFSRNPHTSAEGSRAVRKSSIL